MLTANLALDGEYSYRIYRKDGSLRTSEGPFKNFITSTGLSFPYKYAFADCFRYLSLGTDGTKNSIVNDGTSALFAPLAKFSYVGNRRNKSDPNQDTSAYSNAGYTEQISGVSLFRGWRIPTGEEYFDTSYSFKEIMLSPGQPSVTGIKYTTIDGGYPSSVGSTTINDTTKAWKTSPSQEHVGRYVRLQGNSTIQTRLITSNSATQLVFAQSLVSDAPYSSYSIHDPFSVCSCEESEYAVQQYYVYGNDKGAPSYYYTQRGTPICDGTGAFARIVNTIDVQADEVLLFDYTLNIKVETGRIDFNIPMVDGQNNLRGAKTNEYWHDFATVGCHSLIHHGVKMVCPGVIAGSSPWGAMIQVPNFSAPSDFGESFIGPWGCPLEPSTPYYNYIAHLSTDNLQFCANAISGGAWTSDYPDLPCFDTSSGLMAWRQTPTTDCLGGFNARFYNIRQAKNNDSTPYWPDETNIEQVANPPPTVISASSTYNSVVPQSFKASDRSRKIERSFQFSAPFLNNSNFVGKSIRNITLSYIVPGSSYAGYNLPFLDTLFTDNNLSNITAQGDLYNKTFSTGNFGWWNIIESDGLLTFSFLETWSASVDCGIVDCP